MSDKKITKDYLEKQFSNFADKVSSVFAKGTELTEHIEDIDIHVTKEEKEAWDKKSEVEANPSLSGDEQALASVEVDGVKYKIVSGEGGSTVVPNPSMQGDEAELQSIGIDGTNFKIVGGDASKIKILELNSPLSEQGILNVLKDNEGYLCSGFFYNTDVNVYCEFEGLYSGHIISGETVHFGYCHIKGIHNSTYSIDYAIDDEDGETWYSTVLDGTHVEANPTMEGTETSLNSIKIGDAKYKIPSGGSGSSEAKDINYEPNDKIPTTNVQDTLDLFVGKYGVYDNKATFTVVADGSAKINVKIPSLDIDRTVNNSEAWGTDLEVGYFTLFYQHDSSVVGKQYNWWIKCPTKDCKVNNEIISAGDTIATIFYNTATVLDVYTKSNVDSLFVLSEEGKRLTSDEEMDSKVETANESEVVGLPIVEDLPFRFGIDESGNYGYYKVGADTLTPFSSGGSGIVEIINMNYPVDYECSMTDGITTLYAPDTSGLARFEVPNEGTWTITATDGVNVLTKEIEVKQAESTIGFTHLPFSLFSNIVAEGDYTKYSASKSTIGDLEMTKPEAFIYSEPNNAIRCLEENPYIKYEFENPNESLTFYGVIKLDNQDTRQDICIMANYYSSSTDNSPMWFKRSNNAWYTTWGHDTNSGESSLEWHCYAIRIDTDTKRIQHFIDGVMMPTSFNHSNNGSVVSWLGASYGGSKGFFRYGGVVRGAESNETILNNQEYLMETFMNEGDYLMETFMKEGE